MTSSRAPDALLRLLELPHSRSDVGAAAPTPVEASRGTMDPITTSHGTRRITKVFTARASFPSLHHPRRVPPLLWNDHYTMAKCPWCHTVLLRTESRTQSPGTPGISSPRRGETATPGAISRSDSTCVKAQQVAARRMRLVCQAKMHKTTTAASRAIPTPAAAGVILTWEKRILCSPLDKGTEVGRIQIPAWEAQNQMKLRARR